MITAAPSLLTPELRAAFRAEFPQLTVRDIDAASVLGAGWCVTALRVRDIVVRIPKAAANIPSLDMETRLLPLIAPEVPFVPRGMRALRAPGGALIATAHEYVDGVAAKAGARSRQSRDRLAQQLAVFLGALHSVPPERAEVAGVPRRELWADQYLPMLAATRPHLSALSAHWVDAVYARFLADGATRGTPSVFVHGDLGPEHVRLRSDGSLSGVIDWEASMVADPALDFAGLLNMFSSSFMERVLRYYAGPSVVRDDPGLRRRVAFYIAVVPLFSVQFGVETNDAAELRAGRVKLAARARAALERPPTGP